MNLNRYVSNVRSLANELIVGFTEPDVRELSADLAEMGSRSWLDWQSDHHDEINDFLESTPSARKQKLIWKDPQHFRRLSLAAWERAAESAELLRALSSEASALLWPGVPYRTAAHSASEVFWLLSVAMDSVEPWPFSDAANPFL